MIYHTGMTGEGDFLTDVLLMTGVHLQGVMAGMNQIIEDPEDLHIHRDAGHHLSGHAHHVLGVHPELETGGDQDQDQEAGYLVLAHYLDHVHQDPDHPGQDQDHLDQGQDHPEYLDQDRLG